MKKEQEIKNINLAFPCKENRETMSGHQQEKICEKCSNIVFDFSDKPSSELKRIIDNSNVPVCGRFKKSQITKTFVKYAASAFIATTSLSFPASGQKLIIADSVKQACEQIHEEEFLVGIILDEQAYPKIDYKEFFKKIMKELKYPAGLTEKGKVYVQFTVDTVGNIQNPQIIKGYNELAEREALRVILAIDEKFIPAKQRGKAISTRMVLPITFNPEPVKRKIKGAKQ